MAHAQLAALLRAVAQLHPAGPPDLALVAALAGLFSSAQPNTLAGPAGDGLAAGSSTAPPLASAAPTTPPPRLAPTSPAGSSTTLRPGTASHSVTGHAPLVTQEDGLVAQPSTLARLAGPADLATPQQGQPGSSSAPRSGSEPAGPGAPLESLFAPRRVRAILRGLATLDTASGALDIAAAVALIARAQPIHVLPQRLISTLGHTVQLLLDAGPAMLPFSHDQSQLAASATRLLGRDRVRVADFIGHPGQGVRAQRQVRWAPLQWPGRRSALLVVSDLGLGSGQASALASAWQRFVDDAHQRGLRSVLLIPYPTARWPAVAHAFGTTLSWDLVTGVQALRRSQRAGPGAAHGNAGAVAAASTTAVPDATTNAITNANTNAAASTTTGPGAGPRTGS